MVFTSQQRIVLAVVPKVSGFISATLSSCIVYLILVVQRGRNKTYDRIILGSSVSDILSSLTFFCSTWPIPPHPVIPYSVGNTAICNVQGFTLQMACLASSLYSSSLGLYFWWVICRNWNDNRIGRWEVYLHVVPVGAGLATAVTGLALRLYGNASLWCWITADHDTYRLTLFYAWVWASIVFVALTCIAVSVHVWRVERRTQRFRYSIYQEQNQTGRRILRSASNTPAKQVLVPNQVVLDEEEKDDDLPRNLHSLEAGDDDEVSLSSDATDDPPPKRTGVENAHLQETPPTSYERRRRVSIAVGPKGSHGRESTVRASQSMKRTQTVATRCFWFAASFYVTWTSISLSRLVQWITNGEVYFWLFLLSTATTPIQGLSTFCIYLYPKLVELRKNRQVKRARLHQQQTRKRFSRTLPEPSTTATTTTVTLDPPAVFSPEQVMI